MNREAALLGTPAYSIFTGPVGALDRELIRTGRLVAVRDPESVSGIPFQRKAHADRYSCGGSLRDSVVDQILELGGVPGIGVVDGRNPWAFPS